MATYWTAFQHDITPYLLSGGVIAYTREKERSAEDVCSLYTMEDVMENLRTTTIDHECNNTKNRMRRKYWYLE